MKVDKIKDDFILFLLLLIIMELIFRVLGDFSREERTAEDPPLECMENIADLPQESTDGSEEGHDNRLLQQG